MQKPQSNQSQAKAQEGGAGSHGMGHVIRGGEIYLMVPPDEISRLAAARAAEAHKAFAQGYSYIIKDRSAAWSYESFKGSISQKSPGICITSTYPRKIRETYSLEGTQVIWLSEATTSEEKPLNPRRLEFEITRTINDFVKKSGGGFILIDGLEYLLLVNGFEKVINFIKSISDVVSQNKAALIVPVNPEALDKKELTILERAFDRVEDRIAD